LPADNVDLLKENAGFDASFLYTSHVLSLTKRSFAFIALTGVLISVGYSISTEEVDSNFLKAYEKATAGNLTEEQLNSLMSEYSFLLLPHSDTSSLMNELKGQDVQAFPLMKFKDKPLYRKTISNLFASTNMNERVLSYLVIAAAHDRSFIPQLQKRVSEGTEQEMWGAMALLHLKDSNTDLLFDFLVKHENFGDAHMVPLFLTLDRNSLEKTAYARASRTDEKSRVLVASILSRTGLNPKTEEILRTAIKSWQPEIKGYAVAALKELRGSNLKELLSPLLDGKKTRRICLEALANSPTREDQTFLLSQIPKEGTIPEDVLDALFGSSNPEMISKWLDLAQSSNLPSKYYFSAWKQPLFRDPKLHKKLCEVLSRVENPEVLHNLVRALQGQHDADSTQVLLKLLNHQDHTVRYWAAHTLEGNTDPLLVKELPIFIKDSTKRTTALTKLAIENKINTLQPVYDSMLENKEIERDWIMSCLEYLSEFPLAKHRELFRSILNRDDGVKYLMRNDSSDGYFISRYAAIGLGNLKDSDSVDLIIKAAKKAKDGSDLNARPYLVALSKIRGKAARQAILEFQNSREPLVREFVVELLRDWPE
jgi:hypothetical protein